jgi:hypothetical protein
MTVHRRGAAALAFALAGALGFAAGPALAAQEPLRFELFLKGAFVPPGSSSTYDHAYDPHPGYEIAGSYARQALNVEPLSGSGIQAGLLVPVGRNLGLRLTFGRDTTPFGGANGPFLLYYKYTAYLPPLMERGYYSRLTTVEWPDTTGHLRRDSASLEFVVRLPLSDALSLRLAAGPQLAIFSGELSPLGYEEVIYERYGAQIFGWSFVLLRLPPRTVLGATAEVELALQIDRRVSLILGTSYRTGSYEGTPEIVTAYDYHSLLEKAPEVLARLHAAIVPGPIALSPPPFRLSFGVAIGL